MDTSSVESQPNLLLSTKLYVPQTRPELVTRPQLIKRLDEGTEKKLTLVSAPAGFGKTTLLAEWASQIDAPVAWLSLDDDDNDVLRFLTYVATALNGVETGAVEGTLAILTSSQTPQATAVLTMLVNEIAASERSYTLVLDDYHHVADQPVHDAVTFLLDHLPPQMALIIASRIDPPLSLARLRSRGELSELRTADLRFTAEEVAAFLNQVMGLGLSAVDVAALELRTEGWIAGLQLAALTIRGRDDIPAFIDAFAGNDRHIVDYLAEEVLNRQPADFHAFLLQTSVLNRLTGPLCDAVSGGNEGQAMLEKLERANLFVVPLDHRRRWFRYHHLFADFLRSRLEQEQPDSSPALHQRASEWYEANGLIEEALKHAFAAHDYERAAFLIEGIASRYAISSPSKTLNWLNDLPKEYSHARPGLGLAHAMALLSTGRLDAAESELQAAEHRIQTASDGTNILGAAATEETQTDLGQLIATQAIVACYRGDVTGAVDLSRRALELIAEDDAFWRGVMAINIALNLGGTYQSASDVGQAIEALSWAADVSLQSGDLHAALFSISKMGHLQVMSGQLHEAQATYQRAIDMKIEQGKGRLAAMGLAHVGMGVLLYEWNDLEAAQRHLMQGVEHGKLGGDPEILVDSYANLAKVLLGLGNVEGAEAMIREVEFIAKSSNIAWIEGQLGASRARFQLAQGKTKAAAQWVERHGPEAGSELGFKREGETTTLIRVLLADRRPDRALEVIDRLKGMAKSSGLNGLLIESLALAAQAFHQRGETEKALTNLKQALLLGEPEGYLRLFLDAGEPMKVLLKKAALKGFSPPYVREIFAAFGAPMGPITARSQPLIESLSERELEVLRLIAAGLPNREVAQELVISEGTVKAHAHRIYRKLDVHNRTEAVARARNLEIIS